MSESITPRVAERIRKYRNNSEKLMVLFQSGFIFLLGALYFVAPRNTDALTALFAPVPIALGAFVVLLVTRMILIRIGSTSELATYIFIVLDMVLLVALIWTYHIQYQAPAGLSLKAPTFVFLLFFIVLRALSLEARYVIVSAVAAIASWVSLVIYGASQGPVTHSFMDYASSFSVLVGAEVEKLIAIAACGGVLALAVSRANKLLIFSEQRQVTVQNVSRFFSPEIMKQIAGEDGEPQPGVGRSTTAAIMSIDIRQFSIFSAQHNPNSIMHTLSEYQAQIVPIITEHCGTIDKFMGDGVLAHFGVVGDIACYAANALKAAEDVLETITQWNQSRVAQELNELWIGIGITNGEIVFGTVGDANRLEVTVIGHAVDRAVKIEKATKRYPSSILCTYSLYELAVEQGYSATLSPYKISNQKVGGLTEAVDLVGLLTPSEKEKATAQRSSTIKKLT